MGCLGYAVLQFICSAAPDHGWHFLNDLKQFDLGHPIKDEKLGKWWQAWELMLSRRIKQILNSETSIHKLLGPKHCHSICIYDGYTDRHIS